MSAPKYPHLEWCEVEWTSGAACTCGSRSESTMTQTEVTYEKYPAPMGWAVVRVVGEERETVAVGLKDWRSADRVIRDAQKRDKTSRNA